MEIHDLDTKPFTGGKIKIGKKKEGEDWQGKGLDHIIITTNEKDENGNFIEDTATMENIKANGGVVNSDENLIAVPIQMPYNSVSLNFPHQLQRKAGNNIVCRGDKKTAFTTMDGGKTIDCCPCPKLEDGTPGACKYTGRLSVILENALFYGQPYFGFHQFSTASHVSVSTIVGSLKSIQSVTIGQLVFLPLLLRIEPFINKFKKVNYYLGIVPRVDRMELIKLSMENAQAMGEQFRYMTELERSRSGSALSFFDDAEDENDFIEEYFPGKTKEEKSHPEPEPEHRTEPEPTEPRTEPRTEPEPEPEPGVIPLAESEFKALRSTGLKMFVEADKNRARIDSAEYSIARKLFEKWHRVMGGGTPWPYLEMAHVGRMNKDMIDEARQKEEVKASLEKADAATREKLGGALEATPETKLETGPASEKTIPSQLQVAEQKSAIFEAFKSLRDSDVSIWKETLGEQGVVIPDSDIKTLAMGEKRNSPAAWEKVIGSFTDIDDFSFIAFAIATMKARGGMNIWFSSLEHFGVSKANQIKQDDIVEFMGMVGADIPF